MLIECPECRGQVSDQAANCPSCGLAIAGQASAAKALQAKKPLQQWARFFFFLMLAGVAWAAFREPDVSRLPGPIMLMVGFVGWLAVKWRLWFYT